jgi:hypothetical protein
MVLAHRVSASATFCKPEFDNRLYPRPDVHFHCDINFDPFVFMEDKKKVYGEYSPSHF